MLGKAGVAGTIAVASEPYVDQGLNSLFGKNDYYQRLRTAKDWGQFGDALLGKGDAKWINGQWVDNRGADGKQLESLKRGQDDARRDDKRTADESKGQRNRTNELLSNLLNALFPQAQADTMGPNLVSEIPPASDGSGPRGIRNNNPGNLNFVGQQGASLERPGGRFARFQTPFDGLRAMGSQLLRYFTGKTTGQALDSVRKIISTWAPGSENNTGAYVRSVSRSLGVAPDARLNLRDPQMLSMLMGAITRHENGKNPYDTALITRAAQAATAGIRPGAGMTVDRTPPPRETAQNAPQYHIGSVTVQSNASRVEQLTADINRTAQNRTRVLGVSGAQA